MAVREVIKIDEDLCNGCGACVPGCPEGALQIIDGKARLVSDLFCDGLGACIGECPMGAITVEKREAEGYDEKKVMENIVRQGPGTIAAHLGHLRDHSQDEYLAQALDFLKEKGIPVPSAVKENSHCGSGGCPGSRIATFAPSSPDETVEATGPVSSQLRQWPIQLALLNPDAPYLKNAHLLFAADCVPFAFADFHRRFLKDKTLIMFCPKLDPTMPEYLEKLTHIFKNNNVQSVTIVHMEVPCCGGVSRLVEAALLRAGKNLIIKDYTISIQGQIV